MTITIQASGSNQDKGTIPGLIAFSTPFPRANVAVGDWFIVCIAADTDATPSGFVIYDVVIGIGGGLSKAAIEAALVTNSGNVVTGIYYAQFTGIPAGSADLNISIDGLLISDSKTASTYIVRDLHSSAPIDKNATATGGPTTSASSGATATLSQGNELVIGAIGVEDEIDDMTGTWTTGAGNVSGNELKYGTNGGSDPTNVSIYTAAEIVSVTTAQTAEVTGMDSIDWAAAIATFKGIPFSLIHRNPNLLNYLRM